MRLQNWNPDLASAEVEKAAMDLLEEVAHSVAATARQLVPVGKDRPAYGHGKEWTARRAGALRDSIRVTRLKGDPNLDVRVYAGNDKDVYYARFIEYGWHDRKGIFHKSPFLRPALNQHKGQISGITGVK